MLDLLFPIAMYAETHFRFFGWTPSALFRREPEIVFDLPRRLARGAGGLPLTLLINDRHLYPITVESVQITISTHTGAKPALVEFSPKQMRESEIEHPLKHQMGAYILTIPRSELPDGGEIFVNACLRYRRVNKAGVPDGNIRTALNDNLPTSTKYSYRCVIAAEEYPGSDVCAFGDVHCHSQFSRSHVEFGPPLEMIDRIAAASGLTFAAATDHSYDLACDPDDFLRQDKEMRLWEMYKSAFRAHKGATVLIPGEEISVLNSKGKVVHLCGLGLSEYIPGTLDGARKNVYVDKQLTIDEAVGEIARQGGVSFAAHPGAKAGLMQRIFLRRGVWSDGDIREQLGGIQAVNSGFFDSWQRGKRLWINALQRGLKAPLLAGSDAHGDFNRYRAVGIPFIQINEAAERYMSFARTGIYGKRSDAAGVIEGIREGATFITNGPFVTICDSRHPETSLVGSSKSDVDRTNLCVRAVSTKEFGPLGLIKVIMGRPGTAEECVLIREVLADNTFDAALPIPADALAETCYLRAEAYGNSPRETTTTAATSACFVGY
jgi:predicted metal-dependent phosphoesterase TrpH